MLPNSTIATYTHQELKKMREKMESELKEIKSRVHSEVADEMRKEVTESHIHRYDVASGSWAEYCAPITYHLLKMWYRHKIDTNITSASQGEIVGREALPEVAQWTQADLTEWPS